MASFPDEVKQFVEAVNPSTSTDAANIKSYQTAVSEGRYQDAQNILASITNGNKMNMSASRFNDLLAEIVAIENFYIGLNGVKQYIQDNIDAYVDVKAWSSSTNYVQSNLAISNGQYYLCLQANTNVQPGVTSGWQNYWSLLIKKQKQYPIQAEQPGPTEQVAGDIWFQLISEN